ncbi:DUF2510 domain-containing protein [Rhodococcus oxybenzonivorans]|uniref:DUF2510 domain-containing protein n=1 Tax=Rhodococcus oxybenzonivorans TaxID=1990687 RepID=UPI0037C64754
MTTPTPPAGWHPDPEGGSQLRWWDGKQWTSATKPRAIQEGPKDPPPPIDPKVRKRNNLIAVGVIAAAVAVWGGVSAVGSDEEESTASSTIDTTTETTTASATPTTTTRAPAPTPASTRPTPPPITPTTRATPGAALLPPAQTATEAGCEEPDPNIVSAIEASLTESRSLNHIAAVSTIVDGIEYTYTAANVFRADGSRSVSGAVWVTPDFGVMGLSGNTREVSTLPFGRGVLDVSAGDKYGQQVQECVSALARGR